MNLKRLYRGPWLWFIAILLMLLVTSQFMGWGSGPEHVKTDTSKVFTLIEQDQVRDAKIIDKDQRIELTTVDGKLYEAYWVDGQGAELAEALRANQGGNLEAYDVEVPGDNIWLSLLFSFLPLLLVIAVFFFIMNQMQGGGSRVMNFGKSRAKLISKDTPKTTFADVAGADEAIEELKEIKDFLQNPGKFQSLGAKIPKGVLLYGPPGTGKTLLARAVAGEAGVPFYSISGSDFVEMFVGVGASRVRDLFEQAKANAPAIIFIDEIDAVGRQRGAGIGGGHDEREQTLNQLLVEMDGFDGEGGVIVMAATNRPDILDPALLRPGRFDRQIVVDRPTCRAARASSRLHAQGKPLGARRRPRRGRPADPRVHRCRPGQRDQRGGPADGPPRQAADRHGHPGGGHRPRRRGAGAQEPRHDRGRRRRSSPTTRAGTPWWATLCRTPTRCTRSPSCRAAVPSATPCRCRPRTSSSPRVPR